MNSVRCSKSADTKVKGKAFSTQEVGEKVKRLLDKGHRLGPLLKNSQKRQLMVDMADRLGLELSLQVRPEAKPEDSSGVLKLNTVPSIVVWSVISP